MAFSHIVTQSVQTPSGLISSQKTYTGSGVVEFEETVANSATDDDIVVAIDYSAVKSFYIVSSAAVTLETNATDATGGDTIALAAGVPYVWNTGSLDTFLLTNDVTVIYVTNASGSSALIKMSCIMDVTP